MITLNKRERQIVSYCGLITFIICWVLVIVLTPCMTECVYRYNGGIDKYVNEIVMMVVIPFLCGIIGGFVCDKYREYTLDDFKRALEIAYSKNAMTSENYEKNIEWGTQHFLNKRKTELQAKLKQREAKIKSYELMKEFQQWSQKEIENPETPKSTTD